MEIEDKAVKEEIQPAATEQTPDYKALLEKAEEDRDNYKDGLLKAKGKLPQDPMSEEDREDLATRVAAKLAPELKTTLVSNNIDSKLDKLTQNPDEKELIRYHFEYSTTGSDVDSRLANAQAIANKDLIAKKAQEVKLVNNKQNTSTSMGSSTESGMPVMKDDFFTPEQLKALEARQALTGIKIDPNKLKENIRRTGGSPGTFTTGAHIIHEGKNYN